MATYSDICIAAIQRLTGDSASPSPDDLATALLRLNDLLDFWKNDGLLIYTTRRTTWTLTANVSSYTVGATGTIAIDRPINAQSLTFGLLDSNPTIPVELPMATYTDEQYQSIALKTFTATYPQGFYYDPTVALGTLYPWPIPTGASLSGVIYAPAPAGEVLLSDTVALPQGYRRFVRDTLAVELGPDFQLQPNPALLQSAIDSKADLKRSNVRMVELANEGAAIGAPTNDGGMTAFWAGP